MAHVQNADQRQRMNVRRQGVLADPRSSESIVGKHLSFDSVAETAARLNQLPPVARVPPVSRWFLISPNDFDDHRGKPWNGQGDRSGAEPIGRPSRRDRARSLDSVEDAAFRIARCIAGCMAGCVAWWAASDDVSERGFQLEHSGDQCRRAQFPTASGTRGSPLIPRG